MKKGYTLIWSLILLTIVTIGCKTKVKPLSERLSKTWTAQSVKEGPNVVYTRGGSTNKEPGYSDFRLALANGGVVTLVDRDKFSSTGTWELSGETKLILKGLSPEPTGTGGIIEFTINTSDENNLVITRTTGSTKTGGTINEYTLTNP
jgi:hypothetical protein